MIELAVASRDIAFVADAALIERFEGAALARGDEPGGPAEVEGYRSGSEDERGDSGVERDDASSLRRHRDAVGQAGGDLPAGAVVFHGPGRKPAGTTDSLDGIAG